MFSYTLLAVHSLFVYFTDRGGRENCWGISCEKSRFYAKKSYFFPILGGGGLCATPWIRPWSPTHVDVYSIQHNVIKLTCGRSVVFSRYTNKTDRHDITEILLKLKVALNPIALTITFYCWLFIHYSYIIKIWWKSSSLSCSKHMKKK